MTIIYRGPSLIDNKPIVVLAVFPKKKANAKTGAMVQTYILADNGFDPMYNNKTGEDYSICGNCLHKGTPTDDLAKKLATNRACILHFYTIQNANAWLNNNGIRLKQTKG